MSVGMKMADRLAEAVALLRACGEMLNEISEQARDRMDVTDGPDGQPQPDDWMQLHTRIEQTYWHNDGILGRVQNFISKQGDK